MQTTEAPIIPVFTFGDRLAKARKSAGISAARMAEIMHVTPTTISNWENDRTRPVAIYVDAWAAETGVPVEWLVGSGDAVTCGFHATGWAA